EGRLARAGCADDEDELTAVDVEVDVRQGRAALARVPLGDVLETDHLLHAASGDEGDWPHAGYAASPAPPGHRHDLGALSVVDHFAGPARRSARRRAASRTAAGVQPGGLTHEVVPLGGARRRTGGRGVQAGGRREVTGPLVEVCGRG